MRTLCLACLKPVSTCYCRELRTFRCAFTLAILQHPMERKLTVSTARMTHRCIEGSLLISGAAFDGHPEVDALLDDPGNHCVVLYPGPDALDLGRPEARASLPADRRLVVFVIDGTWASAKKMLRESHRIAALPRVCFTPEHGSEYQFRRQPDAHCVSTLEATHQIVRLLDPAADPTILLELFRAMVKFQLSFKSPGALRGVRKKPPSRVAGPLIYT
jgi:DTW domain-containing protein YfiP